MNGKGMLFGLNYVGDNLIVQAEYDTFAEAKRRRAVRPLLLAALIALLLMLVGCAVVYMLKMQDMKIGVVTETQPILAENYVEIIGYEDVELQVLTLSGLKGSPNYMAAQEWYRFKERYDPEMKKYLELYNAGMLEEFPSEFEEMPIYTREMWDTINQILKKYDLLPPGEILQFRTDKKMCAALEIEKIQTAQNDVGIQIDSGHCCSNGNFQLFMKFSLPKDDESEYFDTWGSLYWCRKDCFSPNYVTIEDDGDWKEWNYTTAGGSNVLIFRSPSDWRAWIVCQREEAQMVLQLEARRDISDGRYTDFQYLTDKQIERIADAIDFSIQPNKVTQEDVLNQQPYAAGTIQNGWNVELKDVKTDGYIAKLLLGITAPEDVDIAHADTENTVVPFFSIYPGNTRKFFTPTEGEPKGYDWNWAPQEDGDGLDNTQDLLLIYAAEMMDGSAPYAAGSVWNLVIEDLMHYCRDSERSDMVRTVLAEGEWFFSIQFDEENGDYRTIELLTEPITLPALIGWDIEGNNVWGPIEVVSIELHPLSVHFISEAGNVDYGLVTVVMKDGTCISLTPMSSNGRCKYQSDKWIDLHQADYLLMQDGTQIPIAENR